MLLLFDAAIRLLMPLRRFLPLRLQDADIFATISASASVDDADADDYIERFSAV